MAYKTLFVYFVKIIRVTPKIRRCKSAEMYSDFGRRDRETASPFDGRIPSLWKILSPRERHRFLLGDFSFWFFREFYYYHTVIKLEAQNLENARRFVDTCRRNADLFKQRAYHVRSVTFCRVNEWLLAAPKFDYKSQFRFV